MQLTSSRGFASPFAESQQTRRAMRRARGSPVARCAPFHNSNHCVSRGVPLRSMPRPLPPQAAPADRLPFASSLRVIICAVLAALSAFRPIPPADAGRAAAGSQIITGGSRSHWKHKATRESLLDCMARCAPSRYCSCLRSTCDCARSPREVAIDSRRRSRSVRCKKPRVRQPRPMS